MAVVPVDALRQVSLNALHSLASGEYDPLQTLKAISNAYSSPAVTQPLSQPETTFQAPQIHATSTASAAPPGVVAPPEPLKLPQIQFDGQVTPKAVQAAKLVTHYLGTPYVWGGESPKGFDCSGLLQYTWAQVGVQIPRTTYDQFQTGRDVPLDKLQPGDAVFFTGSDPKNGLPGHVGMYVGDGQVIQAPHTGDVVRITPLSQMGPVAGARRYA